MQPGFQPQDRLPAGTHPTVQREAPVRDVRHGLHRAQRADGAQAQPHRLGWRRALGDRTVLLPGLTRVSPIQARGRSSVTSVEPPSLRRGTCCDTLSYTQERSLSNATSATTPVAVETPWPDTYARTQVEKKTPAGAGGPSNSSV